MAEVIRTVFKIRRGTTEEWETYDRVLEEGEPGFDTEKNILKIGIADAGKSKWSDLPPVGNLISYKTFAEFPSVGKVECLYKVESTKKLYQWVDSLTGYEEICGSEGVIPEIEYIDGGKANG